VKYLVTRYGSNAANQSMTPSLPVAVVEAESEEDAVQAIYDYDYEKVTEQLADFTVYSNQYLRAKPLHAIWTPAKIRGLRLHAGWSQADLAHELGTHPPTVSRWETGKTRVRGSAAATLSRLAEEVGFPL
jgi:DNA-binding transcriptional regulator YiaG